MFIIGSIINFHSEANASVCVRLCLQNTGRGLTTVTQIIVKHMVCYRYHCIAMLYAISRYLVKLRELETSWGRGDTVTYKP